MLLPLPNELSLSSSSSTSSKLASVLLAAFVLSALEVAESKNMYNQCPLLDNFRSPVFSNNINSLIMVKYQYLNPLYLLVKLHFRPPRTPTATSYQLWSGRGNHALSKCAHAIWWSKCEGRKKVKIHSCSIRNTMMQNLKYFINDEISGVRFFYS